MNGPLLNAHDRRTLSRLLSKTARDEAGLTGFEPRPATSLRIGITGSPGAGKSSLIGILASSRVEAAGSLAVLAIDPTSPLSRGSVLGDRIRMDNISSHPGVFIRSLPSSSVYDGLCSNMEALLRVLERHRFGEIMLETVGAGQVQHSIRSVTDTLVMVLSPHAGDSIQAMKAGLMEIADIYVINKADLPDARRSAADIRGIVARLRGEGGWMPPVIMTSSANGDGVLELSAALDKHRREIVDARNAEATAAARTRHHVEELLHRHLSATIEGANPTIWERPLDDILAAFTGIAADRQNP